MAQTFHRYRSGDKPVGGYKLIRKLGEGGFGEVWLASAPGGAEVALKFIDLTGQQGFREFKSLRLVKKITHINLIPLHGFWLKNEDGTLIDESDVTWSQIAPGGPLDPSAPSGGLATAVYTHPVELIVAMGLGKQSLYDRLRDCLEAGQTGIPVDELLDYMQDAAKGIDYLNKPIHDMGHGPVPVVHSDIKPHNILIVGDGAAVCDFGLAHAVEALRKTCAAPLTLAYAAPESFRGKPGDRSDQYSLAITYVELRTGHLPFDESLTGFEVMTAHVQGQLDFSQLTPGEAAVIRKATAPMPQDRWQSCSEMVRELRRALQLTPATSDFVPDLHGSNPNPYLPASSAYDHGGTMMPPAFPKGDTAPFAGKTPVSPDPLLQPALLKRTTQPAAHAETQRPAVTRRPLSTGAKLFASVVLLAIVGGGYSFWASQQEKGGPWDDKNTNGESGTTSPAGNTGGAQGTFQGLIAANDFAGALKLLDKPDVFSASEKHDNLEIVRTKWRQAADKEFLQDQNQAAAKNYAALAAQFNDADWLPDLQLMQARSAMGAGDTERARELARQLDSPMQDKSSRDRIAALVKFLTSADSSRAADIAQLHALWKDLHASPTSGGNAGANDLWTARPFELKALDERASQAITAWLQLRAARRDTPDGLAELKKDGMARLEQILQMQPENADALVLKADLHVVATQYPQAISTVERKLATGKEPTLPTLQARGRALDAIYRLNSGNSDVQTIKNTLAELPALLQLKDYREMLAGAVSVVIQKSPEFRAAAVKGLRSAASGDDPSLKPLFTLMLQEDIKDRLKNERNFADKAEDYLNDCLVIAQLPGMADETVRACHAEALLTLTRPGAKEALGEPGNSAYYQYVKARVLNQETVEASDELRTTLSALFAQPPAPVLKLSGRLQAAFKMLEDLLDRNLPPVAFNIKQALEPQQDQKYFDIYYELLRNAQQWQNETTTLSDVARARLAVAAWWHTTKKSEPTARQLSAQLIAEWRDNQRDEVVDPRLVYQLYYTFLESHRGTADKPTQQNMIAAVDRLITLTDRKQQLDDPQVQAFYAKLIAPMLPLAAAAQNHAFFARVAKLVQDKEYYDWAFVDGAGKKLSVNDKLDQLYTSAVQLSQGRIADYILNRGRNRLKRKPYSLPAVMEDANALNGFVDFKAKALALAGQGYFMQSREERTNTERLKKVDASLDFLRRAVEAGKERKLSDKERAEQLLLLSYAHLEHRNFAGWDANASDDFQKAAEYALEAEKHMKVPDVETAYTAAGNAFEDLAWFARSDVANNYKKAVENFQLAIRSNPNSVDAQINLGRCYYKMAVDSRIVPPGVGTTLRGIVVNAESWLTKATELAKKQAHENAEAHYWLGRVLQMKHLSEAVTASKARQMLTADEYRAADDELFKAMDLAVKQNLSADVLRVFAVQYAESVLLHPDFSAGKPTGHLAVALQTRANELKKLNLPPTTAFDLDQEVKVLNARATMLTKSDVDALTELDEEARKLRGLSADKATASDAKLMELRFELFAKLGLRDLTRPRLEDWLKDAIWYARLPRNVIRREPTEVLIAARTEAEKDKMGAANESSFTPFKIDWLRAAIESSSRFNKERLTKWYTELVTAYADKYSDAKPTPDQAVVVADHTAAELKQLSDLLAKRGRGHEVDLKPYIDHYLKERDRLRSAGAGATKAKPVSRPVSRSASR